MVPSKYQLLAKKYIALAERYLAALRDHTAEMQRQKKRLDYLRTEAETAQRVLLAEIDELRSQRKGWDDGSQHE